jgi:hypothetical protein
MKPLGYCRTLLLKPFDFFFLNLSQDALCESSESGRFARVRVFGRFNLFSHNFFVYSDVAGKVSEKFDAVLRALK